MKPDSGKMRIRAEGKSSGKAVILFTRVPEPGRTKTRMMPYLSAEECAELQSCFLRDISAEISKTGADLFVCYDAPDGEKKQPAHHNAQTGEKKQPAHYNAQAGEKKLRALCGQAAYFPQTGEDLGARMHNALARVFEEGYTSCLLFGSDIPEIRSEDLLKAFDQLGRHDVVIGPSADGGYWLIGMHRPHSCLFENRQYSHGSVLEELIRTAGQEGLSAGLCRELQDMDTPSDLADFRSRMRRDPALRRSHTGRFLAEKMTISVIVPVYNEISTIDAMIRQLEGIRNEAEIIIADGGSTDGTCDVIPDWCRLLHTPKGRARQMNAGAEAATGDILFFLHCDSELPDDAVAEIRKVMTTHEAGCFGIAFHSRQFFMWTCRVMSNLRAGKRRIMFGDQGIFITRELFSQLGGYPELPIMEDYQLSLTMKEQGVKPGMCRHRIYTSDRRFPKKNIPKLRVMWKMHMLRLAYRMGKPIEDIAAQYRDIR